MGFWSNVFGKKKEDDALQNVLRQIHRILDDEQYQLELVHPQLKDMIANCPSYDQDPKGSGPFGFTETNPIPVNGPIGEFAYLSRIETSQGERLLFHRVGAINNIDVFEAVTFSGSEWFIFFLDLYHPRRSRSTPTGFQFTTEVPQFSGFHKFCPDFPYDFVEKKQSEQDGLSIAYIPIGKVTQQIQKGAYQRPASHMSRLDAVKTRLSSFQS